ncbi:MAG: 3-hydroxyacyl-CoA dehydrogenase family protein [Actinomycetales bacterium]|nr:MAG: 3-hydroxyacyl-CoA dehydrogenase family protein [Actinomycetales bacterium]
MQEIVDRLTASDRGAEIARTLVLPYLNHAATMLESGYATGEDIDAGMRFGCGYPVGPIALIDGLGAQTVIDGLNALHAQTGDPLHVPAGILSDLAGAAGAAAAEPEIHHPVSSVGVVGTGTMASGIAQVFAQAGYDVVYVGRSQDKLDGVLAYITKNLDRAVSKGKLDEDGKSDVLGRLSGSTEREALAGVDLVVEAIAEDLEIKKQLFRDLDRIVKPGGILATTTSSLSIDALAAETARPADVIGMHFFNPAPIMKLVEVVSGSATAPELAESIRAICLNVGKHPVSCGDRAGFIVNALLFPYLNDAVKMLEAHYATADDIDAAMKVGCGYPMGPFELLDVVGLDVSLAIER